MANLDFDLDDIPKLTKTKASKFLQVAVRDAQNGSRASYKPNSRPSWWCPLVSITLVDGSVIPTPAFTNPRDLSLPASKAALHSYAVFKGAGPDHTAVDLTTSQQPQQLAIPPYTPSISSPKQPAETTDDPIDIVQIDDKASPTPSPVVIRRRNPRRKKKVLFVSPPKVDLTSPEPVRCTRSRIVKKATQKKQVINTPSLADEPSTATTSELAVIEVKAKSEPATTQRKQLNENDLKFYQQRVKCNQNLRQLLDDYKKSAAKQLEQFDRETKENERDIRQEHDTNIGKLKTFYSRRILTLPAELRNMRMKPLVEQYKLDKEVWLHAGVALAVERAYRRPDATTKPQPSDSHNDQSPRSSFPPKTPPARTPAARTRRKNVHDTVRKTARRVQLEDALVKSAQQNPPQSARQTRAAARSARYGISTSPIAKTPSTRPARVGEIMYSVNGSPIQNLALRRPVQDTAVGSPSMPNMLADFPVDFTACKDITSGLDQTMRKAANPLSLLADVKAWAEAREAELTQEG